MKFAAAFLFWILLGTVMGVGLVWAVMGHPWLLIAMLAVYLAAFARYGCLHQH
jgi:hypothetical protein